MVTLLLSTLSAGAFFVALGFKEYDTKVSVAIMFIVASLWYAILSFKIVLLVGICFGAIVGTFLAAIKRMLEIHK